MAIRPVDLQLAYMAAPQNAAAVSSAQQAPQAAQQAAAASFAAEVTKREESVDEPQKVEGAKVRARGERDPSQQGRKNPGGRDRRPPGDQFVPEQPELPGGGEHFIDVTA